jgi:hypothetical protein
VRTFHQSRHEYSVYTLRTLTLTVIENCMYINCVIRASRLYWSGKFYGGIETILILIQSEIDGDCIMFLVYFACLKK